jgi:UPF0716 protein FxsA
MFFKLFLLFTVIPLIEIWVLIQIGQRIGAFDTIALIILTGILGAFLARSQGFFIISKIQNDLQQGRMPADSLTDGLIIIVGAVLLITPGLITDIFGFLLLVPQTRLVLKQIILRQFKKYISRNNGYSNVHFHDQ